MRVCDTTAWQPKLCAMHIPISRHKGFQTMWRALFSKHTWHYTQDWSSPGHGRTGSVFSFSGSIFFYLQLLPRNSLPAPHHSPGLLGQSYFCSSIDLPQCRCLYKSTPAHHFLLLLRLRSKPPFEKLQSIPKFYHHCPPATRSWAWPPWMDLKAEQHPAGSNGFKPGGYSSSACGSLMFPGSQNTRPLCWQPDVGLHFLVTVIAVTLRRPCLPMKKTNLWFLTLETNLPSWAFRVPQGHSSNIIYCLFSTLDSWLPIMREIVQPVNALPGSICWSLPVSQGPYSPNSEWVCYLSASSQ